MKRPFYTLPAFWWFFIKKHWGIFLIIQLSCFVWSIEHTFWPYVIKELVDKINNFSDDPKNIYTVIGGVVWLSAIVWIIMEISYRVSGVLMAKIFPKIESEIRLFMFDYVQHHSLEYFATNFAGNIANRISDMPKSTTKVLQVIMSFFVPALVAFLIACQVFYQINMLLALVLSLWVLMHMGLSYFFSLKCDNYSKVHSQARSTLFGKIIDSFTNNLNVKLFARQRFELDFLKSYQKDEQIKHSKVLMYIEKMRLCLGILCFLATGVAMFMITINTWQQGLISVGQVVLVLQTSFNIMLLTWIISQELPVLFKEIGTCNQAITVINHPHAVVDKPKATSLKVSKGDIVFDNVTFNYGGSDNIFYNKTIHIKAGSKVGLVGFSGSGKTTFVNLILRFYDIHSGKILIDGQDIAHVSQQSLRSAITMIPQDCTLFHRSLMENIRYGNLSANDEEVIKAAKLAHAHEFIEGLEYGYNTLVGERGSKLSGGQRQRIAIARAIIKNSPILILDEATSALDSITENEIKESLDYVMHGKTTIVIAHRLATLSNMDRILVFHKGSVVEDGTHEQLIEHKKYYYALWQMQHNGFLPDNDQ